MANPRTIAGLPIIMEDAGRRLTMSRTSAAVLLWLFVINLGIAVGAGLYEERIVVPRWIGSSSEPGVHWHADAARPDDTGRRFRGVGTTVPRTLLTPGSLLGALRAPGPLPKGWR